MRRAPAAVLAVLAFAAAFLLASVALGGEAEPRKAERVPNVRLSSVSGLPKLADDPAVARELAQARRAARLARRLRARRAAARRAAADREPSAAAPVADPAEPVAPEETQPPVAPVEPPVSTPPPAPAPAPAPSAAARDVRRFRMRLAARQPVGRGLEDSEVIDGYVVENFLARSDAAELVCQAVGADGEPVTLEIAWNRPADHQAWPRFRRLARTRATLQHEALLPVRAVGEHSGRPYMAMARYPETTFEDLLEGPPLSSERVLRLLAPVCDALDLAHAKGLVHSSLSGTSLLVEGDAALLDGFGVAGGPPDLTLVSLGVHEMRYRPPEVLQGQSLEPAGNVYTLAALLVHALTGMPPYNGAPVTQAYQHLVEPPPVPSERRAELGAAFDDVIARGMAKDPAERPASARELLDEAAAALGVELPTPLGSEVREDRGGWRPAVIRIRWIPKHAVIAALVLAAAAGLAAGVILDPFGGTRASAAVDSGGDARALARLDDQRTALRQQLSASETPQEQAEAATDLAGAYREAARIVGSPDLESAALAYEELGAAAVDGSAERFVAAGDQVERAEDRLAVAAAAQR